MKAVNGSLPEGKYIIQGSDFKAKQWMEPFGAHAEHFISVQDLLRMLFRKGRKNVIFRYQNSSPRVISDFAYTLVIVFLTSIRRLLNTEIFWVMHNIDRETVDKFPILTKVRRAVLKRTSKYVFVTDPMFKRRFFPNDDKVTSITFGPKFGGATKRSSMEKLAQLRQEFDLIALCLGASGEKYKHYQRLERLSALAKEHGKTLLLIIPKHAEYQGENSIRINDKNVDENVLAPFVDFVYRINDDVSMPYTIYAACCAQIPIVTGRRFFTFEIINEYGIGFSEEDFFTATDKQIADVKSNMARFMEGRSWRSLADALLR